MRSMPILLASLTSVEESSECCAKANRDFRGYRDLVGFFSKEFNPNGDQAVPSAATNIVSKRPKSACRWFVLFS